MQVPRIVSDVVIGGLWVASAVEVAGYTWNAVSSTWSSLPEPGSGSGGQTAQQSINKNQTAIGLPKNATGLIDFLEHPTKYPSNEGKQFFGLNGPITHLLEKIFSSGSIKNQLPSGKARGGAQNNYGRGGPIGSK